MAFSPDGTTLATSDGTTTQIWDVTTRKLIRGIADNEGGSQFLLFAPDGKLLVGVDAKSRLWDLAKDQLTRTLPLSFKEYHSAIFSPDSSLLACGTVNGTVELWNVQTAEKVRVLTGLKGYVPALTFSPDGRTLAGGGWRGVMIWEMATGQERRGFHDLEGDALSLAFAPDGRVLASEAGNGTIPRSNHPRPLHR